MNRLSQAIIINLLCPPLHSFSIPSPFLSVRARARCTSDLPELLPVQFGDTFYRMWYPHLVTLTARSNGPSTRTHELPSSVSCGNPSYHVVPVNTHDHKPASMPFLFQVQARLKFRNHIYGFCPTRLLIRRTSRIQTPGQFDHPSPIKVCPPVLKAEHGTVQVHKSWNNGSHRGSQGLLNPKS
jgi:hypothetical protein